MSLKRSRHWGICFLGCQHCMQLHRYNEQIGRSGYPLKKLIFWLMVKERMKKRSCNKCCLFCEFYHDCRNDGENIGQGLYCICFDYRFRFSQFGSVLIRQKVTLFSICPVIDTEFCGIIGLGFCIPKSISIWRMVWQEVRIKN